MNRLSDTEKEYIKKVNTTYLYALGYKHIENMCDEMDEIIEVYQDIEVPDSLDDWFSDYNATRIKKEKKKTKMLALYKVMRKIAVAAIVICMMCSVAIISVEASRVYFFNMVTEIYQKYSLVFQVEVDSDEVSAGLPAALVPYSPTYLPEGYILTDTHKLNNTITLSYKNSKDDEIIFLQSSMHSQLQLDSENGKLVGVNILGHKGTLIIKSDISILYWTDRVMFFVIKGNIEKSQLLKIAESVQKNK